MRIALLAMTEPAVAGQTTPRAFLRVAGASVAQHQLGIALALDCQRVICLARRPYAELSALQTVAENAGLQFHVASAGHQLSGLVTARDELIVISEGLFADGATAADLLARRKQAVLVQPVERAVAEGFERIDINRAAGGIIRISAQLVERLHDLPPDVEVPSALTRIALQAGVETCEISAAARANAAWLMVRDESEAHDAEVNWLRSRLVDGSDVGPSTLVAGFCVRALGATLLHAGNASNGMSLAVLALLFIGSVMAWFSMLWAGFAAVAIAGVGIEAARLLRNLERQSVGQLPPAITRAEVLAWSRDAVMTGMMLAGQPMGGGTWIDWLYAPASLILLLLLLPRLLPARLVCWLADRFGIALVLAVAALVGQVQSAVELVALGLAITSLFVPRAFRE